ncbi:MAG: D-alanyl-D-alanine carboxypeptidase [Solirubrobacterales bacterium]|nr:D-alanyl-D-alanine carboxypeptidase [Solirubrobacterales bacterium]MCB8969253.1 D-alanyl-D-alanine carboxypeptidase [Thermoleophilales bacterium]MCO5328185.1 D-alanyl-D-alanine carboxypeptidase [Solirubrobacterales bacterium]
MLTAALAAAALVTALVLAGSSASAKAVAQEPSPAQAANPDAPASSRPSLARTARRGPISAGKLKRKLGRLARKAPGSSGFYVYDIDAKSKRVLFDRSEGKRRLLASNEKLFTTTTALGLLGPDSQLETRVKADGKLSRAGKLQGDLYLIGDGDPTFGAAGIADLADDVRRSGIKRISGKVYGDDSIFDTLRGVPDSNWGASPYFAPLSGLVYGGSTYAEDPAKEAARAFRDALRGEGIKVGGKVKVKALPGRLRKSEAVGEWKSDTIARLAAYTNKPSDNFFAEMLLKRLDASGSSRGTTRGGTKDVERFVAGLGSKVDAKDGSGLTRHNRSSPRDVVRLLTAVSEDRKLADPLYDSLSIAGRDGTLGGRMGGTVAAGRCRGKTGTITGVSNVSGYCKSGGHLVAFSILMNGVGDLTAAHNIQDDMVVQIARYRP